MGKRGEESGEGQGPGFRHPKDQGFPDLRDVDDFVFLSIADCIFGRRDRQDEFPRRPFDDDFPLQSGPSAIRKDGRKDLYGIS